jgi:hypothetical protein
MEVAVTDFGRSLLPLPDGVVTELSLSLQDVNDSVSIATSAKFIQRTLDTLDADDILSLVIFSPGVRFKDSTSTIAGRLDDLFSNVLRYIKYSLHLTEKIVVRVLQLNFP